MMPFLLRQVEQWKMGRAPWKMGPGSREKVGRPRAKMATGTDGQSSLEFRPLARYCNAEKPKAAKPAHISFAGAVNAMFWLVI